MSLNYIIETLKSKFGVEVRNGYYTGVLEFLGRDWCEYDLEDKLISYTKSAPLLLFKKVRVRKVETPCSKCGSNRDVWCIYSENWRDTPFGESFHYGKDLLHICLECGHGDRERRVKDYYFSADYIQISKKLTEKCPYCGYEWKSFPCYSGMV